MHHLFPLGENEVVLLEVLSQKLGRCLTMLHDDLAVLVIGRRLVQVPPPTTLLEELKEKWGVIASADESAVVFEKLSFEV